jgi:uncharacterized protein YdeI (YjbR/CyaY-like superfamily)
MSLQAEERAVEPHSRAEWRAWLAAHAEDGRGAWLVLHKGRPAPLTYEEAVEEALAAGWIDSKANKLDAARYKLWVAPRKRGSVWAGSNKERVARLSRQGLMTPRGLAIVEAAKADGSWNALDGVMALEIPPELMEALGADPNAAAFFEGMTPSQKRIVLEWIREARTAETRRKRIRETVESAARGLRPHQWRPARVQESGGT